MSSIATTIASPKKEISQKEWEVRVDLAACYRLIHHFGWTDQIYNHISARIPEVENQFLLNPFGLAYNEVTASNLVKVDLDGNIIGDSDYSINRAGYVIHSAVHSAREDVLCVLHTHTPNGSAVSCLEEGFIPMTQAGLQFHNRLGYHEYEGIAVNLEERERLVADLGEHKALMLYNHGLLTCGGTVSHAFTRLYYLEQACGVQLNVMQTGGQLKLPSPKVCEHTAQQWEKMERAESNGKPAPEWLAYLRLLDDIAPDFRQ